MFIKVLLIVVEIVTCILLIGVILLQRSKSQGMGVALGGQMGEQIFGAQMGNVLTKATVVLATIFLVNTALLAYLSSGSHRSRSVAERSAASPARTAPALPAPAAE